MNTKTRTLKRKAKSSIEKNIDKFPHLKNVKESIEELKNYVEYLNTRKSLIGSGSPEASDFEKNENKILICETNIKISKANKTINERTDYFNEYYNGLIKVYPEVEEKFNQIILEANKKSLDKKWHAYEKLNKELKEAQPYMETMSTNWEIKFRFYIELKTILESKPEAKKSKK